MKVSSWYQTKDKMKGDFSTAISSGWSAKGKSKKKYALRQRCHNNEKRFAAILNYLMKAMSLINSSLFNFIDYSLSTVL